MSGAPDPPDGGSELAALRDRLRRAGLLFDVSALSDPPAPDSTKRDRRLVHQPPHRWLNVQASSDARELQDARAAAGRGTPLSDLVSEGRR